MNDWNSEPNHPDYTNSWDQGVYETGSTRPPKSHGGLIALLLAVVILLGGIASVLGFLNIRLVSMLKSKTGEDLSLLETFAALETEKSAESFGMIQSPAPNFAAEPEPAAQTDDAPVGDGTLDLAATPESPANVPPEGGLSLQQIYADTIDSVVSIVCQSRSGSSSGTGVVLTADGYVVTNYHVVSGAKTVRVLLWDDREFDAQIVGTDEVTDLAVLYIEADGLSPAVFGDSSVLRVGDSVVAIGDPLGTALRGTMTNGIVSAINRDITTGGRTMTLIQTNAALNEGNSGGPLLNCYGQVIGINTMKIGDYSASSGVEGLGFAIPSATVKEIVDQLVAQGFVSGRPSLGIEGENISAFYQLYYMLPSGVLVTDVTPGSDAADRGVQEGDILLALDGTRIYSTSDLKQALYRYHAGDSVSVVIYRSGKEYELKLTLSDASAAQTGIE